jgi:DnaJ-class molecular chaperone
MELLMSDCFEQFLKWRNIPFNSVCNKCSGSGVFLYSNTSTWRGGLGGQALTYDVCDSCWGSGNIEKKGFDLKKLK